MQEINANGIASLISTWSAVCCKCLWLSWNEICCFGAAKSNWSVGRLENRRWFATGNKNVTALIWLSAGIERIVSAPGGEWISPGWQEPARRTRKRSWLSFMLTSCKFWSLPLMGNDTNGPSVWRLLASYFAKQIETSVPAACSATSSIELCAGIVAS